MVEAATFESLAATFSSKERATPTAGEKERSTHYPGFPAAESLADRGDGHDHDSHRKALD